MLAKNSQEYGIFNSKGLLNNNLEHLQLIALVLFGLEIQDSTGYYSIQDSPVTQFNSN